MESSEDRYDSALTWRLALLEILRRSKSGESLASIAQDFGGLEEDVRSVRINEYGFLKYVLNVKPDDKILTMKSARKHATLEDAVYLWIMHAKERNRPVFGRAVCEKAAQYSKQLGDWANFVANKAWLRQFKARYGIKEFDKPSKSPEPAALGSSGVEQPELEPEEEDVPKKTFLSVHKIMEFYQKRNESTETLVRNLEECPDIETLTRRVETIEAIIQ